MSRKDLVSYSRKVGYHKHPGMVMWFFHRVSGVVIGLFFLFHLIGAAGICPFLTGMVTIHWLVAVVGVLFFLHTLNGIRIILMEFTSSVERSKFALHLAIICILIVLAGGVFAAKILMA